MFWSGFSAVGVAGVVAHVMMIIEGITTEDETMPMMMTIEEADEGVVEAVIIDDKT